MHVTKNATSASPEVENQQLLQVVTLFPHLRSMVVNQWQEAPPRLKPDRHRIRIHPAHM